MPLGLDFKNNLKTKLKNNSTLEQIELQQNFLSLVKLDERQNELFSHMKTQIQILASSYVSSYSIF